MFIYVRINITSHFYTQAILVPFKMFHGRYAEVYPLSTNYSLPIHSFIHIYRFSAIIRFREKSFM